MSLIKVIARILWESIKETFRSKFWNWFFSAGLFALIGLADNLRPILQEKVVRIFLYIVIIFGGIVLTFRLVVFVCKNSFKYLHSVYRESKYGDAILLLNEIFDKAQCYRQMSDKSKDAFIEVLKTLCNNLQKAFSEKNACDCSVSIKIPITEKLDGNATLMNICRDKRHESRDNANYQAVKHTVLGNTPFSEICYKITGGEREFCYINNNIPKSGDHYRNTSRMAYHEGVLPYNSEIVVPIISVVPNDEQVYHPLGFLCVDCAEVDKFEKKYDVPLIEGVAKRIYDIMEMNKQNDSL